MAKHAPNQSDCVKTGVDPVEAWAQSVLSSCVGNAEEARSEAVSVSKGRWHRSDHLILGAIVGSEAYPASQDSKI